jgi:hypothetical protein
LSPKTRRLPVLGGDLTGMNEPAIRSPPIGASHAPDAPLRDRRGFLLRGAETKWTTTWRIW